MENVSKNISPVYPKTGETRINGGFFGDWMKMVTTVSAKDILKKFDSEGALANYERVARGETGGHIGPPWYHGLICECIRGISDILVYSYDEELDRELDRITALIKKASDADPDGFVNPYTTLMCPVNRWGRNGGNIIWLHETYNTGCLVEAGVHRYLQSGKKELLAVAVRMANYYADFIGDAPKHNVVCEHSLPEKAFLRLYALFNNDKALEKEMGANADEYLRLTRYFIDHKGDNETRYTAPRFMRDYSQDHRYAREQREAVGHAVRATLFYEGIAALAIQDRDAELERAALAIWKDITETKLHINGCVGAHRNEEKFGYAYELPNNAYLETCAGVGLIFFGSEIFRLTGDASVFDAIESTVENLIPASVSLDGVKYTYENPLESRGEYEHWSWHGCPCCPPMLLKLVGILPSLIFARNGDNVWLNMFIDSTMKTDDLEISLRENKITVNADEGKSFTIRIRVPYWTRNFAVSVNGKTVGARIENGYAVVEGITAKDAVELSYDTPIVKYIAHPFVAEDKERVAVKRGAMLYCIEQIDNEAESFEEFDFILSKDAELTLAPDGSIYADATDGRRIRLVPYREWNNRNKGFMRVWLRQEGYAADPLDITGWEEKLYRPLKEYNA